jgi:hypothetical protein
MYVIVLVVFYLSIPAAFAVEKLIFLARGYDRALVFEKQDTYAGGEMIEKYYDAFRKESRLIAFCSWVILALWTAMLISSIIVIRMGVAIPFKLDIITVAVSSLLLLLTVGPILIFGKGWPPRPF